MTRTDHPLTETDVRDACHRILSTAGDLPTGYRRVVNLFAETVAALAPTDPHHDPRPWQDCTVKDIRAGDLVEVQCGGITRTGIAHHQDAGGEWWTEDGRLLTYGDHWPLRRIPAAAPAAEEVELPDEFGAVITDVEADFGETLRLVRMIWTGNRWTFWDYSTTAEFIHAFTLPDGTRARRDGERPDGTPRFVKVQEEQK